MRARSVLVAMVLALLGVGLVPVSASAVGGTAPACVYRSLQSDAKGQYVYLQGGCSSLIKVRVVWDNAPDSACYTLTYGGYAKAYRTTSWARYDRTVTC